jgi:HEPN domain-containing protein
MDEFLIDHHEWMRQAEYDLETAEIIFERGRYIHAVFMCHLAVEKVLKAYYQFKFSEDPPKTHNLLYLAKQSELDLPNALSSYIDALSTLSVPTRYPSDLRSMMKDYNNAKTRSTLDKGNEVITWIKELLSKKS